MQDSDVSKGDADKPSDTLHSGRPQKAANMGCLIFAILFACLVGLLCAVAFLSMIGGYNLLAVLFAVGIALLIVGGVIAVQLGVGAAVAIFLVSASAFVLMWGLCSQVRFNIH